MEENKIPTPPSGMRKMPPPPPAPPKAQPAPPVKQNAEEESKLATSVEIQNAPELKPEKPSIAQANGVAPQVEQVQQEETKKLKKEKKKQKDGDYSDIDIVDVRRSKKVDGKAMFYYVGIFVTLAIMAVIIFLILK